MKKNFSQRPPPTATPYNISLVKYQNPKPRDIFDLTTVHSLLIDQNDKFIKLKQLIIEYNSKQTKSQLSRPHFDRLFMEQLYKMLCEVTRMCHFENQRDYLNKIYKWAFRLPTEEDQFESNSRGIPSITESKARPNTASTRTRPYSAHTRKARPDSGIPTKYSIAATKKSQPQEFISQEIISQYPQVDFKQLKYGEKQFYQGHRTMHPELAKPKIRLKDYHRKVLYNEDEEQDNKFDDFFEEDEKMLDIPFQKQINLKVQVPQLKEGEENKVELIEGQPIKEEGEEGQPDGDGIAIGEQQVNIDDLMGEDEGMPLEDEEQEQQVIDKLKPKIRPYQGQPKHMTRGNAVKFYSRIQAEQNQRNNLVRNVIEDTHNTEIMKEWAHIKSKVKTQQKRRSQSARLINKHIGLPFNNERKQNDGMKAQQIIDLTKAKMSMTKVSTKPKAIFKPQSERVYQQKIKGALITGKLSEHLKYLQGQSPAPPLGQITQEKRAYNNWVEQNRFQRTATVGVKPKKKTFEQILRQAEEKVIEQTNNEVDDLKQKLSMNRIAIGGNKIAKSLTYHLAQVQDGQFMGTVIGTNMLNNPYFKVAKKKKKKKKKK